MSAPIPFTPEDIFLEQRITHLDVMPQRHVALCAVRRTLEKEDRYASDLWALPLDDGVDAHRLTQGDALDTSPRCAPDGHTVAFLSDRGGGTPQIHLIDLDGGEAVPVGFFEAGVQSVVWRPDGRQLLACCTVRVDPERRREGTMMPGSALPARSPEAPELVWRLPYKADGVGYGLDKRTHLFLLDIDSGQSRQLTVGDFDVNDATWMPDGRHVVYCRSRDEPGQAQCHDLWMLELKADEPVGEPRRLSFDQATAASPSCSPDGRWIVFMGAIDEGDSQNRLWLIDTTDWAVSALGDDAIEVVPGELHWHCDTGCLAFIRARHGLQEVATITVPDGVIRSICPAPRQVAHLGAGRGLAFTAESADRPLELYTAGWGGSGERCVSRFNAWWQTRSLPVVERRHFDVPDGLGGSERVAGWLLLPQVRSGPVPLLLDVHGGPASYTMLAFAPHAYWQVLCARGWAVLSLDAVGSSSYGREFCERLTAHWGEMDLPQHIAAIEQLQQGGVADERLAIVGGSYGGYMAAWAIGQTPLFRVAVVSAPVANLESHFGSSDSGYYSDPYAMDAAPAQDHARMWRLSPMAHIDKARTPTLFLQGKDDQRCPVAQSEELFVKLRRTARAPAEMVLYPGGDHHVLTMGKPSHRLDGLRRIVAWLEQYVDKPLKA